MCPSSVPAKYLEKQQHIYVWMVGWLVLILYIPVNSYGHVGTVTSPNHTFFPGQA